MFTFRFRVSATAVDSRDQDKFLSLELSLRLPQTLFSLLGSIPTTDTNPSLGTILSKPQKDVDFRLCGCSTTTIFQIGVDEMRALLLDAYNILLPTVSTLVPLQIRVSQQSTLFSTPKLIDKTGSVSSLTLKLDHARFVVPSRGFMTFAGSLNFLDF